MPAAASSPEPARKFGWLILGALLFLAIFGGFIYSLVEAVPKSAATVGQKVAFGDFTALLVLALFTLLIIVFGRRLGGLVIGADKRVSTSKFQVLLWTYAIGAVLVSLVAASWVGLPSGLNAIKKPGFDFGPYLVLLGGPFLAAIGARALVGSQVEKGETVKPPGTPAVSQIATDDSGSADLIDSQYLLFNLIAVVYFLGAFIGDPQAGFPTIPTLLYALTGAAALGYVTNKAIPAGAPTISSVFPATAAVGKKVTIYGSNLLFPKSPTQVNAPTSQSEFLEFKVMIGGVPAPACDGGLSSSGTAGDRIKVKVPPLTTGRHDVVVLNFSGTESQSAQLDVSG